LFSRDSVPDLSAQQDSRDDSKYVSIAIRKPKRFSMFRHDPFTVVVVLDFAPALFYGVEAIRKVVHVAIHDAAAWKITATKQGEPHPAVNVADRHGKKARETM